MSDALIFVKLEVVPSDDPLSNRASATTHLDQRQYEVFRLVILRAYDTEYYQLINLRWPQMGKKSKEFNAHVGPLIARKVVVYLLCLLNSYAQCRYRGYVPVVLSCCIKMCSRYVRDRFGGVQGRLF